MDRVVDFVLSTFTPFPELHFSTKAACLRNYSAHLAWCCCVLDPTLFSNNVISFSSYLKPACANGLLLLLSFRSEHPVSFPVISSAH